MEFSGYLLNNSSIQHEHILLGSRLTNKLLVRICVKLNCAVGQVSRTATQELYENSTFMDFDSHRLLQKTTKTEEVIGIHGWTCIYLREWHQKVC